MVSSSSLLRLEYRVWRAGHIMLFLGSLFEVSTSLIKLCMLPYLSSAGPSSLSLIKNTPFLIWFIRETFEGSPEEWRDRIGLEAGADVMITCFFTVTLFLGFFVAWGFIHAENQAALLEEEASTMHFDRAEKGESEWNTIEHLTPGIYLDIINEGGSRVEKTEIVTGEIDLIHY